MRKKRGALRRRKLSLRRALLTVAGIEVRSGYEARVIQDLVDRKVPFSYEPDSLAIQLPVRSGECTECGAQGPYICKHATYCVDLRLDGAPDIRYVELKGRLTSGDRTRLKALYRAWGGKFKLYLLFQRNNRLSKVSKTTYLEWAQSVGFTAAVGDSIPEAWCK